MNLSPLTFFAVCTLFFVVSLRAETAPPGDASVPPDVTAPMADTKLDSAVAYATELALGAWRDAPSPQSRAGLLSLKLPDFPAQLVAQGKKDSPDAGLPGDLVRWFRTAGIACPLNNGNLGPLKLTAVLESGVPAGEVDLLQNEAARTLIQNVLNAPSDQDQWFGLNGIYDDVETVSNLERVPFMFGVLQGLAHANARRIAEDPAMQAILKFTLGEVDRLVLSTPTTPKLTPAQKAALAGALRRFGEIGKRPLMASLRFFKLPESADLWKARIHYDGPPDDRASEAKMVHHCLRAVALGAEASSAEVESFYSLLQHVTATRPSLTADLIESEQLEPLDKVLFHGDRAARRAILDIHVRRLNTAVENPGIVPYWALATSIDQELSALAADYGPSAPAAGPETWATVASGALPRFTRIPIGAGASGDVPATLSAADSGFVKAVLKGSRDADRESLAACRTFLEQQGALLLN